MKIDVAVIDYGVGNLFSVRRAFEHCGARAIVSDDPQVLLRAPRLVLPGVGAFANGMRRLVERGLDKVALAFAESGKPLLGICLGMQLLFEQSEEFGLHAGLGLVPGKVVAIPPVGIDGVRQKIPHTGWSTLCVPPKRPGWEGTILSNIRPGDAAYFVHSYTAAPEEESDRVADCYYHGWRICAAVERGRVVGCQFHPEKSGKTGFAIISAFSLL